MRLVCTTLEEYQQKIPQIVQSLHDRLDEIPNKVNSHLFTGIHMVDATNETDGYWKCVEVTEINEVPEGMDAIVVPSQTYASIDHHGIPWDIHLAYSKMHEFIEQSGYKRVFDAWTLERFDQTQQLEGKICCKLYDPIIK
ncbi:GyrI-like domain-containing protein [Halobacillus naozhouensis]|uniref:GyrI-like domain-containing protein n=1 Tax=Halobacillus naozhouensis TaxID=554880 RepID=A0ABY8J7S8_9BACI|nr:GyrI-like domain-containing protein [Halobacillus naozhouensis]WFT76926.1 GyrI-like domain-containing protein [Halobacillus naozhouensis]